MKTQYFIQAAVWQNGCGKCSDEWMHHTIAIGLNKRDAIKFAKQTTGTVEVVAEYQDQYGNWCNVTENDGYEHIGFVDGEQHYHDKE